MADACLDFIFNFIKLVLHLLIKAVFNADFWAAILKIAADTWEEFKNEGSLTRVYAVAKKVAGSFAYTVVLCIERACESHGIHLEEHEKQALASALPTELPQPTRESIQ